MTESEVISFDAETGITHTYHYDHADDTITVHSEQDVTPIMQENRRLQNQFDSGRKWNKKGMALNRVASIPHVLYYKLKREGVLDDPARLRKWLNDPDNNVFRTRPGKV